MKKIFAFVFLAASLSEALTNIKCTGERGHLFETKVSSYNGAENQKLRDKFK